MTTRNGVYTYSEEASACSTVVSMSSGSYSGLAMQQLDQRKRKELMTAKKFTSSGKAEQYVMEQLRGLPSSYVVVRKVPSSP